jgi:hypothetical protein
MCRRPDRLRSFKRSRRIELIHTDWLRATDTVLQGEADIGVAELTAAETNNDLEVEQVRNSTLQFLRCKTPSFQTRDRNAR